MSTKPTDCFEYRECGFIRADEHEEKRYYLRERSNGKHLDAFSQAYSQAMALLGSCIKLGRP